MTTLTEEAKVPETKANTRKSRAIKRAKKTGYGLLIGTTFLASCKGKEDSPELKHAVIHEEKSEQYKDLIEDKEKNAEKILDLTEELKKARKDSLEIDTKVKTLKKELKKDTL